MRIDLFLKEARIIKRRTIAKEYCERNLVLIKNKNAKPSSEVKDGDIINITFMELFLFISNVYFRNKAVDCRPQTL